MPLFEYQCKKCGKVLEVLQKSNAKPLAVHDHCGGMLEKLLSTTAFQFKGTGFYATDYAKGSSDKSPGKKPETKETTTDSAKPAAEATPAPAKS